MRTWRVSSNRELKVSLDRSGRVIYARLELARDKAVIFKKRTSVRPVVVARVSSALKNCGDGAVRSA